MKVEKLMTLILATISICCVDSDKNISNLAEVIPGFWYFHETDSSYAEIVMTEKIYWAYDDRFGVVAYDYQITSDDSVKRFYRESGNYLSSFKAQKITKDTIWAVNNSNFKFVLHRLILRQDPNDIIIPKSNAADEYVTGYRERKAAFEERK